MGCDAGRGDGVAGCMQSGGRGIEGSVGDQKVGAWRKGDRWWSVGDGV